MSKLPQNQELWIDIRDLIEDARQNVSRTVNTTLTVTYWKIGERINVEILKKERAAYGDKILPTLSAKLVEDYGNWNYYQKIY